MSRRTWFRIHQWGGLTVALLLVLSAATGLVLLFRDSLSEPQPPAPIVEASQRLSVDAIVARAEAVGVRAAAAAGGEAPPATDVALPQSPTQPYTVWLDDDAETEVYLAADGRVLGTREGSTGLTRLLFRLHTGELLGPLGTALMVLAGVGLLVLVTSGLSMLWSRTVARRGRIRRAARARDAPVETGGEAA